MNGLDQLASDGHGDLYCFFKGYNVYSTIQDQQDIDKFAQIQDNLLMKCQMDNHSPGQSLKIYTCIW